MSKPTDRMVYKRGNEWVNKANGNVRASTVHSTQAAAVNSSRNMLKNAGGGELTIKGTNQLIRQKNTVPSGNDPRNIKG